MAIKLHPTDYVSVNIQLPVELAERFQQTNYNWEELVRLVISEYTPHDLSEWLLNLYFDCSRLLTLNPHEITPNSVEHLYVCQQLIYVFKSMESRVEVSCTSAEESE